MQPDISLVTGEPVSGRLINPPYPFINGTLLTCRTCLTRAQPFLEKSGDHIKATCVKCGSYIQFVPKHNGGWRYLYHIQWGINP